MTPLVLLTVGVILVVTPLLFWATWFCWHLAREQPDNGAARALAVVVSAATAAFILLVAPTLFFIVGQPLPFSGQLVLAAIDILGPASVGMPLYLRWTRRGT